MSLWFRTLCLGQWLLLLTSQLSAAPGVSLPIINNAAVGPITTPLRVSSFTNMVAAQFVIIWNKDVLSFQSVDAFALPTPNGTPFNLTETANGILRFAWASGGQGSDLADNSALFTLHFTVVGALNSGSEISITELSPTALELVRYENSQYISFGPGQVDVTQGFVAVGYVLNADEASGQGLLAFRLTPNPSADAVFLNFELSEISKVNISLHNIAGQCLYIDNQWLMAGSQRVELPKTDLPPAGAYLLTVRTPKAVSTQPLYLL